MDKADRIAALRRKREASLQYKGGPPLGGYEKRVQAIDEEVARLEADNG